MTIQQINERQAEQTLVFDAARKIREILDGLADVDLGDGRDAAEEALAMVTE